MCQESASRHSSAQRHTLDSTVPKSYHHAMHEWPEGEIRKVSYVWQDDEEQHWLVVFDLANLVGRIECTGVAIRSSLGPNDPSFDFDSVEAGDPLWEFIDPLPDYPDNIAEVRPRRIRATTMRFPFAEVLRAARQGRAMFLRDYADDEPEYPDQRLNPGLDVDELREIAEMYDGSKHSPGGRAKYDRKFLRHVAIVYQEAWRQGEVPPGKAVREAFDLSPNIARKVIHRCRLAGDLPPADERKAAGWPPGEAPWECLAAAGSKRYLTREEQPDVVLAQRTRARADSDGCTYGDAMRLELADDPGLARRYAYWCFGGRDNEPGPSRESGQP